MITKTKICLTALVLFLSCLEASVQQRDMRYTVTINYAGGGVTRKPFTSNVHAYRGLKKFTLCYNCREPQSIDS